MTERAASGRPGVVRRVLAGLRGPVVPLIGVLAVGGQASDVSQGQPIAERARRRSVVGPSPDDRGRQGMSRDASGRLDGTKSDEEHTTAADGPAPAAGRRTQTADPARLLAGRPQPKSSANTHTHWNSPVLHRPVELAQTADDSRRSHTGSRR